MVYQKMSAIQKKYPLSPKKPFKKTVKQLFFLFLLIGFVSAYLLSILITRFQEFTIERGVLWIIGLLGVLPVIVFLYQLWYYKTYFYDLTDDFVIIKKGPIAPLEITIPYERIQDIYIEQDIFDRFFGLYDVHISSATMTSGGLAHIDGVNKDSAHALRALILKKVKEKGGGKGL